MLRVGVCVSGGGTNLQALIDRIDDGTVAGARIVAVISNNPQAYAIKRAEKAGIETFIISPQDYPDRDAFYAAFINTLDLCCLDLVVLAGFLVILPPDMFPKYRNRVINIHPSLIPSFCGTGYYGLKVHEAALARGVKVTGATVHFVDEGTDSGPIILQKAVEVLPGDTPESLQRRVMEEAEWVILPEAVGLIAAGRVRVEDRRVIISDPEPERKD